MDGILHELLIIVDGMQELSTRQKRVAIWVATGNTFVVSDDFIYRVDGLEAAAVV